ncbi:AMP-binding protein [Streptomyces sp. NPDC002467]|uniref:AMP-binding protein n=1 Tax=Streptomyces sp. NPDC002467 TaxID=3364647 RepID=UPI00367EF804
MSPVDYLDKGASLGPDEVCLSGPDRTMTYAEVQAHAHAVAAALARSGIEPGESVAVLSHNDLSAFATVFGIARRGAVWCPVNPRNTAREMRQLLELFDCRALVFHPAYAAQVAEMAPHLPEVTTYVCLDDSVEGHVSLEAWTAAETDPAPDAGSEAAQPLPDGLAMLVGTGGTTGAPKGVMLTAGNLEAMTALTLMGYPFEGRPTYLALTPLTHAAGVLCFPILALGGRIVVMSAPDVGDFLRLIESERVTHTFLPPTVIYGMLDHERAATTDYSSLQCFWYGAAPMSPTRLEEAIELLGPVMGQLFGQTEAPMMVASMHPRDHVDGDGKVVARRLSAAGRPGPLVTVAVMDDEGRTVPTGERGEIVVRGSLVMAGYYKNPEATAEASRFGWHHTGDIGFLDEEGFLHVVDRAKDMIITGGFNVYSAEVEQALMQHPAVADCAVVGLPDDKWGERVTAVLRLRPGAALEAAEVIGFAKERIGSVKAPKQVEIWPDLPRSKVGKVLKSEVKRRLV